MVAKNKTVGFFGLTGNPPHIGHCIVIDRALKESDEVWVSLVYQHPHGKNPIAYSNRFEMTEIILNEFFSKEQLKRIKLVETDKDYFKKTQSMPYSYNLLCDLRDNNQGHDFKLVIGEDNIQSGSWEKFFKYKEIEAEFGLIVSKDTGVHSTGIRQNVKNLSLKELEMSCLSGVAKYLKENDFY